MLREATTSLSLLTMRPSHGRRGRWKGRLLCLVCLSSLVSLTCAIQTFVQEPQDVTVKHGEAVTLPCRVADRKGVVQWTRDAFGLGIDPELEGFSRYHMVVNESLGQYDLHIQPVLVEDDTLYQCQVGGGDGETHLMSRNAKLTVHFPPKDSDDQVYLDKTSPMETTAGAPVRITCEAGLSTPPSKIKWFRNGEENFPSGKINTTNQKQADSILVGVRSHLDLTPDKEYHQDNITCQVSHDALEEPIVRSLIMLVKYPPDVKVNVDSVKIKEFDDVTFSCEAEGNPPALRYRWKVNDISVVGDHTTEYTIQDIPREKNGATVSCIVANSIGTSEAQRTISVEYAPRFKKEPQDQNEDEGNSVTLTCDVDGNPPPEIVWLHEGQNKFIKLGSKLTVAVTPETVGTYHCRAAVPGFPEESRSMKVFMRGAPKVTPVKEQFGLEGNTVQVECAIESVPPPSEVVWTKDRVLINPNESRYSVLQDNTPNGILNTLVIHDARLSDFGLYNCTAKNGYGSHMAQIELKRQICHLDKEMAIRIAFRESLPLVTTLVAIIGGIIFLVVVVIVIILFKKKGKAYKDPGVEKHSMRSSDRSSTHDSVLKVETRTGTGSDLSPSEEDDYSSHDDWDTSDTIASNARRHEHFRYSADSVIPSKEGPNNNGGGYVQYVDYSRDYNPPPPLDYGRNSIYSSGPQLNNVDPRYSAAYGNPYLRVPSNPRGSQIIYGTTGSGSIPTSAALAGGGGGMTGTTGGGGGGPQSLNNINNNNLNNMSMSGSGTYGQIGQNRNNLRNSANMNNQYIMLPQGDSRHGVHGTHI